MRALDRMGIQPTIDLSANGAVRANVAVGEEVPFGATVEVPPAAGYVVGAEWDFVGVGDYPIAEPIDQPHPSVRLSASHAYSAPGTYFVILPATSQREGDAQTPYGRVQNIARARVIVE